METKGPVGMASLLRQYSPLLSRLFLGKPPHPKHGIILAKTETAAKAP